jgi:hypothetical protein
MTPSERQDLVQDIAAAIATNYKHNCLSEEEISYVRLAIVREAQSIKLRQAIIEKTITGLVWLMVAGIGASIVSWLNAHGMKI